MEAALAVFLTVAYLTAQPTRYTADVVLEAPTPDHADVARALIEFGALPPELADGAALEVTARRRVLRLIASGADPRAVVAAVERTGAWLVRELDGTPAAQPRDRGAAREAERRILTDPPAMIPYWTARALMADGGGVQPSRPFVIIRRSEARIVPKPWRFAAVAAGLAGLTFGGGLVLGLAWWREL